jgi:hypothetical protein
MKNKYILTAILVCLIFIYFAAQSKNKQIEVLTTNLDSLKKEQVSEKKKRVDFSNGTFNDDELLFIINYFKKELKHFSEEELESKLLIDSIGFTVHSEGELGYVPAFDFKRNYNTSLAGDLDNDGTHEILFNVGVTGGGTAYWGEIYCLKILPNNDYLLFKIDAPCGCKNNYECREPNTKILKVKGDILTIEILCFLKSDANCWPSSIIKSRYKFIDTTLVLLN